MAPINQSNGRQSKTAIWLRRSNQTIIFEKHVIIRARRGAPHFLQPSELFRGESISNVSLIGHGARLEMHRDDYFLPPYCTPPYIHHEFRMTLGLYLSHQIKIVGLTFSGSGGDGISLISVSDVLINHRTLGKDQANITACDMKFINSTVLGPDNPDWPANPGVFLSGSHLTSGSIMFDGLAVSKNPGPAVQLLAKGVDAPPLIFRNCNFTNTATHGRAPIAPIPGMHDFFYVPITLQPSPWGSEFEEWSWPFGGLSFTNVIIRQSNIPADKATPWLRLEGPAGANDATDLRLVNISISDVTIFTNQPAVSCKHLVVNGTPSSNVSVDSNCHPLKTDDLD